ncbi:flagellar basal body P-ring formation chaperone FlgA [Roseibium sp.]|uniref:flagellar basal body P-ring formation chaperone FlgA n=1 Tax=Roseibium sp. TaxID=1936156 RepID=UPI003A96BFD5
MKSLLALAGMAIALLATPSATIADGRPVLRSEVSTLSEIVTVGDFYTSAGEFADAPLFRSPDLGTSGDVPAETVAKRARAAGLVMAGTDGLSRVTVHRRAEVYDLVRLKQLTANALAKRDASLAPQDLDITFYRTPSPIQADPSSAEPVAIERILWSRTDGRFTLFLNVEGPRGRRSLNLTGHAREMMEVVALSQPLTRGTILRPEAVTTIRMARQQVPVNALESADAIAGLAARNNLRANSPLTRNDFERPVMVARGEKVTLTFELPGMKLTTRGQAMDDGAKGDVIDIMNLQSRRIVPAIVTSRGQVRVAPSNPIVASLNGGKQ